MGFSGKLSKAWPLDVRNQAPLERGHRVALLFTVCLATVCPAALPALAPLGYQPDDLGRCHSIPGGLTWRQHEKALTLLDLKTTHPRIYGGVSSKPTTGVSHACHNMLVEECNAGKP